jgi:hypothetical protein
MRKIAWGLTLIAIATVCCGWIVFADHSAIVDRAPTSIVDDDYVEHIPKPTDNMVASP